MKIPLKPMNVLLLALAALVAPALTGCRFDAPGLPFSSAGDQRLNDGPALQDARVDLHLNDFTVRADRTPRRDFAADVNTPRPERPSSDHRAPDQDMADLPQSDMTSSLSCEDTFSDLDDFSLCIETASTCTFYSKSDHHKRSCDEVCLAQGKLCLGAYEDLNDDCTFIFELYCSQKAWDSICMCLR